MAAITANQASISWFSGMWLIVRRELRDTFRDWRMITPIVMLTVFFPVLMTWAAGVAQNFVNRFGTPLIAERLIPFLMLIVGFFPISFSLVIALEAFVGERERKSLEPLLSTPLSDGQLYVGKMIASLVPALLAAFLGIGVYLLGLFVFRGWTPPPLLLAQVSALTFMEGVVMVAGAVVVSSHSTSVRAANLLASFIIIPVAFLLQGESVLLFWGNGKVLWLAVVGVFILASLLIRVGIAHFQREYLLGREFDVLNLRWAWISFWASFREGADSVSGWYQQAVFPALRRLTTPMALMLLIEARRPARLSASGELATLADVLLPGVATHFIQLDNTAPEVDIHIDSGGDCKDFTVGATVNGHFVARDQYFGSYSLATTPFAAPAGQLTPTSGTTSRRTSSPGSALRRSCCGAPARSCSPASSSTGTGRTCRRRRASRWCRASATCRRWSGRSSCSSCCWASRGGRS